MKKKVEKKKVKKVIKNKKIKSLKKTKKAIKKSEIVDEEDDNFEEEKLIDDDYTENTEKDVVDVNIDIEDIELSETAISIEEDTDFDIFFKARANKHKLEDKHALKTDIIFKGKIEEVDENDSDSEYFSYHNNNLSDYDSENYDIMSGTQLEIELKHNDDYLYKKDLSKDIYIILRNKTDLDFSTNRRKPNRQTFNTYYKTCIEDLNAKYTKSEIFVELSYYFTDNIFNMFKLLEKKNAAGIIMELKDRGYLKDIGNINFI